AAECGGEGGSKQLEALATELLAQPGSADADFVRRVRSAAAEELRSGRRHGPSAEQAFRAAAAGTGGAAEGHMRWCASALASMLLALTVNLQPASALDQVTYSEFLDQVKSLGGCKPTACT
ncbi:unnamed protein product, partial [Prorocentrum cordatum]